MRLWLLLLLTVLLPLGGCGFDHAEPPPHGLTLEPLVSFPIGEPVETFFDVQPGRWKAEITKTWRRGVGTADQRGRAVVELLLETLALDAGWQTQVEVCIVSAEGIADNFVRAFDGLRFHYAYDAQGRPDPTTLRFDAIAPAGTRTFLRGFWPAGLCCATPWFPARKLRVGETWTREDLGQVAVPGDAAGAEHARIVAEGGGRLEGFVGRVGEGMLDVRLATLLTVDGVHRGLTSDEPTRMGVRDRGRASIRARDGMPMEWSLVEDIVIGQIIEGRTQRTEFTLTVEGRTTAR